MIVGHDWNCQCQVRSIKLSLTGTSPLLYQFSARANVMFRAVSCYEGGVEPNRGRWMHVLPAAADTYLRRCCLACLRRRNSDSSSYRARCNTFCSVAAPGWVALRPLMRHLGFVVANTNRGVNRLTGAATMTTTAAGGALLYFRCPTDQKRLNAYRLEHRRFVRFRLRLKLLNYRSMNSLPTFGIMFDPHASIANAESQ